jgi:hypothetical protein
MVKGCHAVIVTKGTKLHRAAKGEGPSPAYAATEGLLAPRRPDAAVDRTTQVSCTLRPRASARQQVWVATTAADGRTPIGRRFSTPVCYLKTEITAEFLRRVRRAGGERRPAGGRKAEDRGRMTAGRRKKSLPEAFRQIFNMSLRAERGNRNREPSSVCCPPSSGPDPALPLVRSCPHAGMSPLRRQGRETPNVRGPPPSRETPDEPELSMVVPESTGIKGQEKRRFRG